MGWKTVKEHYGIKHIVQVDKRMKYGNEPCIYIGSPYFTDIIVIRMSDAKILKRYEDGRHINELLYELQPKLDEDEKNGTLKQLIEAQDTFGKLMPVYYIGDYRHIVKMCCEKYGYPNVTTDGLLMYENTFVSQLSAARCYLVHRTRIDWRIWWWHVKDRFREIGKEFKRLRFELEEVWNCVYVRCWGRFFVVDNNDYCSKTS